MGLCPGECDDISGLPESCSSIAPTPWLERTPACIATKTSRGHPGLHSMRDVARALRRQRRGLCVWCYVLSPSSHLPTQSADDCDFGVSWFRRVFPLTQPQVMCILRLLLYATSLLRSAWCTYHYRLLDQWQCNCLEHSAGRSPTHMPQHERPPAQCRAAALMRQPPGFQAVAHLCSHQTDTATPMGSSCRVCPPRWLQYTKRQRGLVFKAGYSVASARVRVCGASSPRELPLLLCQVPPHQRS